MLRSKRYRKLDTRVATRTRSTLSVYLKEVMYGAVDGIITTFAIVAGFSGATLSNESTAQLSFVTVLLFGLVNLFGDGVSLGLGNFLAVRSEQGFYKSIWKREQDESEEHEGAEARETRIALMHKGFSEADARTLTDIYRKNESYWIDFIVNNELKISNPLEESAIYTGLVTFCAFISFGLIPLVPFIIMKAMSPGMVFFSSACGAFIALVLLGLVKWKVVGTHPVRSIAEVVLVGGIAAFVAFLIGSLFSV